MTVFEPATEDAAADAVRQAYAARMPLAIEGGGTRRGLGKPMQAAAVLSLKNLTGITLHEPAELVIAARAGTTIAAVNAALAAKNQRLAFEPMDHRALYGSTGEPTIGAVAAINNSGPRRIQAGAARDSLLGIRFVNGLGEVIKNGGRVMKNVTGLDLVKLVCGSHGTLGVLTEVTFKALPAPETSASLLLNGLDDRRAVAALALALGSPFEVTGAAHLPAAVSGGAARTLLRLEGFAFSVTYRFEQLRCLLAEFGAAERLDQAASEALWRSIRDAVFVATPPGNAVWRISTRPGAGPDITAAAASARDARFFYDWGGGLIWLSTPASDDAGAAVIRAALSLGGGHATLVRAPDPVRAAVQVFQPLGGALEKITRGIKTSFDPAGILSPGRMG